jgi:hypothetical protein
MHTRLAPHAEAIEALCRRLGVKRLELFGSAATGAPATYAIRISRRKSSAHALRSMAERRPKLLFDALSAIGAARTFILGVSLEDYSSNLLIRSADLDPLSAQLQTWLSQLTG